MPLELFWFALGVAAAWGLDLIGKLISSKRQKKAEVEQ